MRFQTDNFKIAAILAALFTQPKVSEREEHILHEWISQRLGRQKLSERILDEAHFEKNEEEIRQFSSEEAWTKVSPSLEGTQLPPHFSWKKEGWKIAATILLLLIPASYFVCSGLTETGDTIATEAKSYSLPDMPATILKAKQGKKDRLTLSSVTQVRFNAVPQIYTDWKRGEFSFANAPLKDVFSYLSKWYDFDYKFEDKAAGEVRIGARLQRYQNMNRIINLIDQLPVVDVDQHGNMIYISSQ
ncbi:MAG: DUF4974 domain-containing protein [Mediterranea sp.]|jgi:hypothetical protein|nr:DUF4974 domain-containing protein [Mediterranea sp.]